MHIVILDYATLGYDLDLSGAEKYGTVTKYENSTKEEAAERIKDADAIIVNKIKMTRDVLENASKLKIICETATGYDNIDIEYCKERGILVSNTPAYSSSCVAQVTVSMVCSLFMHLKEYRECVDSGRYTENGVPNSLVPIYHELYGKTWGIIGMGNIGKKVAQIATAFGCKVIFYSVTGNSSCTDYERVDFDTLLKESDFLSLHCPLSDITRNLINLDALKKMKETAILINVARGPVVNDADLYTALNENYILGAGLDVTSTEPMKDSNPLSKFMDSNRLIITPHMAWASIEARTRVVSETCKNIEAFLDGKDRNIVNK